MTGISPNSDQSLNGRYTVRHRSADGSLSDVVGWLLAADADEVVLRDRRDRVHTIRRDAIVASRRVPDLPARRRRPLEDDDPGQR